MADRLKQIPQKLLDIWKSWSVKKRIIIVSSIVAFYSCSRHIVSCTYTS